MFEVVGDILVAAVMVCTLNYHTGIGTLYFLLAVQDVSLMDVSRVLFLLLLS